ncbi:hypothetical protein CPB83DRAFT_864820 [Crepidotus variabilis]|uniref:Uncharacterized protein n=1 Tax=Crepidotus variabilis TaxID=179855 RepID=A0A9P6E4C2_9AGAR|nr:hypothetical protein CPB83DRAFT_864820 [Crepidotus variabilis]
MLAKLSLIACAWSFFVLVYTASAKPTYPILLPRSSGSGVLKRGTISEGLNTNAQRLAAGLSPFPPVRRSTRVDSARRGTTSSTPTGGQIQVKLSTGGSLGYLTNGVSSGFYILTSTLADAATFTFSGPLLHRSTATTTNPYVAALIPTSRNNFVLNSVNAILGDAGATPPGATPQPNNDPANSQYDIESAIWSYDAASRGVVAQLVRDDGTVVQATVFMYGTFFYLSPDFAAVVKKFPTLKSVTFTLV